MILSRCRQILFCSIAVALLCPSGAGLCASPLENAEPSPRLRLLNAQAVQDSAHLRALLEPTSTLGGRSAGHRAVKDEGDLCTAAIRSAEGAEDLPPGLLGAIARVESGRRDATGAIWPWPWTVNADGRSRYFADRHLAVSWTRLVLRLGAKAVDVGCMQVDLQQHPDAFASLEEAFTPTFNAQYAAKFMRQLWAGSARENWMVAAGYYHSHNAVLSADYLTKVRTFGYGLDLEAAARN